MFRNVKIPALHTNVRLANLLLCGGTAEGLRTALCRATKGREDDRCCLPSRKGSSVRKLTGVKVGADSVKWLEGILGEYRSNELGPLALQRKYEQSWADFESWSSALDVGEQPDGSRVAVLTRPPLEQRSDRCRRSPFASGGGWSGSRFGMRGRSSTGLRGGSEAAANAVHSAAHATRRPGNALRTATRSVL